MPPPKLWPRPLSAARTEPSQAAGPSTTSAVDVPAPSSALGSMPLTNSSIPFPDATTDNS